MRVETRTVRIGEKVGEVDWSFDFRAHYENMGAPPARRDEVCARAVAQLRAIVEHLGVDRTGDVRATQYDCGGYKVIDVGMYDGWPYWRPFPSIQVSGHLGVEWWPFWNITSIHIDGSRDRWQPPASEGVKVAS